MRYYYTLAIILLVSSYQSLAQEKGYLTEQQAREEAEIAIKDIKDKHPNQYWYNSERIWKNYEEKLLARKGPVKIEKHYFDLAYLFSLTTDTHTQIYPDAETPAFSTVYPIRFRTFADGLYILAANKDYEKHIGKKVISFGEKPAAEVMDIISNYVSADHPIRKGTLAEFLLVMPGMYESFGLASKKGNVKVELENSDGKNETIFLDKVEDKSFAKIFYEDPNSFGILVPDDWKSVEDVLDIEMSVSRQNLRENYWHTYLPMANGEEAVYMQVNANSDNEEGETQFDFILRVFQELRAREEPVARFIVDLRYDLGGWIKNTAALSRLLYGAEFYALGKTVVLIGRESVSAGTILAADIEMSNYAYYIGEPSGSKPNMFLDHKHMDLPYSKFYAESATSNYVTTTAEDKRMYLVPDLIINETFTEYSSGRDVVLEKALEITAEEMKDYKDGFYRGDLWKRSSQKAAFKKQKQGTD